MEMKNIIRVIDHDVRVRYLVRSLFTLHQFLRTAIVGPFALQTIGAAGGYGPKYASMSDSEKGIIDWCILHTKRLEKYCSGIR